MANARFLLRPRWLLSHLLVALLVVVMISLGFWQLRRLDERKAFNDEVASRIDLPPQPLDSILGLDTAPELLEWRSVVAEGTYLPDEEFVVVNRSQGGAAGELVVTPLALADGRILLVERGFVPLDTDRASAPEGDRREPTCLPAWRTSTSTRAASRMRRGCCARRWPWPDPR